MKWKSQDNYTVYTRAAIDGEKRGKEPGPSSSHENPISSQNDI